MSAGDHEPRRADDLLERWARVSGISPPVPPTRRRSAGFGPLLQEPTRDPDLLGPEFLGQVYLDAAAKADIDRAWLVFVDHPKVRGTSAASIGLLVAPIDEHWYVWIAH